MEDWRDKLGALKGLYPADEQTDSEQPAVNEPTDDSPRCSANSRSCAWPWSEQDAANVLLHSWLYLRDY